MGAEEGARGPSRLHYSACLGPGGGPGRTVIELALLPLAPCGPITLARAGLDGCSPSTLSQPESAALWLECSLSRYLHGSLSPTDLLRPPDLLIGHRNFLSLLLLLECSNLLYPAFSYFSPKHLS